MTLTCFYLLQVAILFYDYYLFLQHVIMGDWALGSRHFYLYVVWRCMVEIQLDPPGGGGDLVPTMPRYVCQKVKDMIVSFFWLQGSKMSENISLKIEFAPSLKIIRY